LAPRDFVEYENASVDSLPKLKWMDLANESENTKAPPSKPDGNRFSVVFSNKAEKPVRVFWMNRKGVAIPYGTLEEGWSKPYQTRPGAVWMITDINESPLGYFVVGDRTAHAVIPKSE
ncbi:MAG: iduronate-2-sulfatase, partial [Planctomycetota bacterium]